MLCWLMAGCADVNIRGTPTDSVIASLDTIDAGLAGISPTEQGEISSQMTLTLINTSDLIVASDASTSTNPHPLGSIATLADDSFLIIASSLTAEKMAKTPVTFSDGMGDVRSLVLKYPSVTANFPNPFNIALKPSVMEATEPKVQRMINCPTIVT